MDAEDDGTATTGGTGGAICDHCSAAVGRTRLRCPSCRRLRPRGKALIVAVILLVVLIVALSYTMAPSEDGSGDLIGDRAIGTGEDDFWSTYPTGHSDLGSPVIHPEWVEGSLTDGPLLILVHTEGCVACALQLPICQDIRDAHPSDLTYVDLLGGRDDQRLYECLDAYDPAGSTHYVPLTILVTLRDDGAGNAVIVWHSWEGVVKAPALNSWVDDAIEHWPDA